MKKFFGISVSILCLSLILAGCGGGGTGGGNPKAPLQPPAPTAVILSDPLELDMVSFRLSWTQNNDSDFASYKIYLSYSQGVTQSSNLWGTIKDNKTISKTLSVSMYKTKYYIKVYVCDTGSQCVGSNEVNVTTDSVCGNKIIEIDETCDDGNTTSGDGCSSTCQNESSIPIANVWIDIPAGDFIMGCTTVASQCASDELPKHTVTLKAYKIQKFEVTNAQYKDCRDAGICDWPDAFSSSTHTSYYGNATYNNFPIIAVEWNMASAYCGWIGGRLPTEAEWEKAARGPSPSENIYPWGDSPPTCSLVNGLNCIMDTIVVGSYLSGASPYGVMDMSGNVYEYVNDRYASDYYTTGGPPWINPQGPATGAYRVIRGGSWADATMTASLSFRVFARYGIGQGYGNIYGFRCAKD